MKKLLAIALMAMGLMATSAKADPIGPDCTTCFGGIYTLEYAVVTPTEYLVRLLINSSGYTGPAGDYIQAVAIKPANSILLTSSLVSTTAPGSWTYMDGGLDSGGCDGSGGGFACAFDGTSATVGTTYQWIFDIKVANASDWLLLANAASIKVNYDPHKGILVSEHITLQPKEDCCTRSVPEPQPLILIGLGLFVLAAMRRRRAVSISD